MLRLVALALSLSLSLPAAAADADTTEAPDWTSTVRRVAKAVVSIRVDGTRFFDGKNPSSSQGTGFVVDAEQGWIITNRHVLKPGPTVAEAVFESGEEIPVQPVYYDPVHDFAFYRFNPADIRHSEVVALELHPERARVGAEIRVVGNDSGEKLSILAGTLARLTRQAPSWDLNTFYYQAASNTSGGSSGSPVVDAAGHVLGLNAGSNRSTASAYYLPLPRVVRALDALQRGERPTRGTLQVEWRHRGFDELRRLGLSAEREDEARAAGEDRGLLVAHAVLPSGAADGRVQSGDILLALDGEPVRRFVPMEAVVDERVGERVRVTVLRGGVEVEVEIEVADLDALAPKSYLEAGRAVLHDVSWLRARGASVPTTGVYVAGPGYAFRRAGIPKGAVITEVDGTRVSDLDAFEEAVRAVPHAAQLRVRWHAISVPKKERLSVVDWDRRWFPLQRCTRGEVGSWSCEGLDEVGEVSPEAVERVERPETKDRLARSLGSSLVTVRVSIPYKVDGVHGDAFRGTGLVLDAEAGLVVADRNTVPVGLGDVTLQVGGAVEIPARVKYVHPLNNLTVIEYDPALLAPGQLRSAVLSERRALPDDKLRFVGLNSDERLVRGEASVAYVDSLELPASGAARFRQVNLDHLVLSGDPPPSLGGVLVDKRGDVAAFWGSVSYRSGRENASRMVAMPVWTLVDVLELARQGASTPVRELGVELKPVSLAEARRLGLDEIWASRMGALGARPLRVERAIEGADVTEHLRGGDLVLAVNGEIAADLEAVARAARGESVRVTVLSDGTLSEVDVETIAWDGIGTPRVLFWAGAQLQAPHRAARLKGFPAEGVYVSMQWYGSPASRYGLYGQRLIVAVDEQPVNDLDDFRRAIAGKGDREDVRLTTLDDDGRRRAVTLKTDLTFWPTYEVRWTEDGWERTD